MNNRNALVWTLECDDRETIVASFAGLEGSNFNVTTDERVFVYTWIHIDARRSGWTVPTTTFDVRGLQGVPDERLVTCGFYDGIGHPCVKAIGVLHGTELRPAAPSAACSSGPQGHGFEGPENMTSQPGACDCGRDG